MKIALSHWQGRIAPVFDVSEHLVLIHLRRHRVEHRQDIALIRGTEQERIAQLLNLSIDLLICGAISNWLEKSLVRTGIQVAGFRCGDIEAIIRALQNGCLIDERFFMPGWPAPTVGTAIGTTVSAPKHPSRRFSGAVQRRRRKNRSGLTITALKAGD